MDDVTKKLKAAAHLVIRRYSTQPEKLGRTKLHKIFWYTDGYALLMRGEPVFGDTYVRKWYGPMSLHLDAALKELISEGKIFTRNVEVGDWEKAEFFSKVEPDTSNLSAEDLKWLESTATEICEHHTANTISEKTHDVLWDIAGDGEELHYGLFLVKRCVTPSPEVMAWAKQQTERRPKNG